MDGNFLTNDELHWYAEGTWLRCYDKLGAHPGRVDGQAGYHFAVWAPHARQVWVAGSFNHWRDDEFAMLPAPSGGVWHLFIPDVDEGAYYKYVIETEQGERIYKADPLAFYTEQKPQTASRTVNLEGYRWKDAMWLARRKRYGHQNRPLNIYEVHPGSWKCHGFEQYFTYEELTHTLIPYVAEMGYTHLELLPIMEHPFDGSWGYQVTGYYAPSSRYGSPREFMAFVDACHRAGLGVILDWVPGHFCRDAHGLGRFDGEMCYERGDHLQWGTYKFDTARGEVRSFLLSSALFWLEKYHIDGIRVDGVTSMLYLNFDRQGQDGRVCNEQGGEEDLHAISLLQLLNRTVGERFPGVMMIAEESTAWPLVTQPPHEGGLGFHYKWDMGWMNDTLRYMKTDFPFRPWHHDLLTFSMMYAFQENFILPLSHDEVVHGKCSLIGRMPGDYWRQFAGLRTLALYQICHPGGKLNFMGNELAQFIEWRYYEQLEWFLVDDYPAHAAHQTFVASLNYLYRREKALWQQDNSWEGFQWLDPDNQEQSVLSFVRRGRQAADELVVVLNFHPNAYQDYRIGVPRRGCYQEVFNSDETMYGGSGLVNSQAVQSEPTPWHGMEQSIVISVPPLGGTVLKRCPGRRRKENNQS